MTVFLNRKNRGKVMDIVFKISRLWIVILPTALLVTTFHYAHHLHAIINSTAEMGFKRTIALIFISFLAVWALLYLSSLFLVRILKWIWHGTTISEPEKSNIHDSKIVEPQAKSVIEYHDAKEQENLFRLDLQDEPVDSVNKDEQQEQKIS